MTSFRQHIAPYRNVIIFVVVMLLANTFWKLTVHGDDSANGDVFFLGCNVTPLFNMLATHTARVVYAIVGFFRDTITLPRPTLLRFDNGHATSVVWSCTPIKQIFIFTCILLATPPYRKREILWTKSIYLIVSGLAIYGINILRITAIVFVIENHPEWFTILHGYVFKYVFYGLLFLMWVGWTDLLVPALARRHALTQEP